MKTALTLIGIIAAWALLMAGLGLLHLVPDSLQPAASFVGVAGTIATLELADRRFRRT